MAITTKRKALLYTEGANIDANYGPWDSIADYESFITEDAGLNAPYDATTIAVKNQQTGVISKYIYENSQWRLDIPETTPVDLTDIESRLNALEADKNAALVSQITSSVTVSPSRYYKGTTVSVTATGKITIPSGIPTSKISAISITGGGKTDSGSNKTQVQVSGISTSGNASNISFSLTGTVDAPFTKSISTPGTCTACNPVYIGTVSSNVTTKEAVYSALATSGNLVYSNSNAITTLKGISKSITYDNTKLAVICSDSSLSAKGASQLAAYPWAINGESYVSDNITYKIYLAAQPQTAHTDTVTFS